MPWGKQTSVLATTTITTTTTTTSKTTTIKTTTTKTTTTTTTSTSLQREEQVRVVGPGGVAAPSCKQVVAFTSQRPTGVRLWEATTTVQAPWTASPFLWMACFLDLLKLVQLLLAGVLLVMSGIVFSLFAPTDEEEETQEEQQQRQQQHQQQQQELQEQQQERQQQQRQEAERSNGSTAGRQSAPTADLETKEQQQ
ncbi:unnamed protein product [Polarella glacialis]|uniref:Uncharacterized protein n=1 Tax=Polarella glacialis TaxID=89957 RepID=A0A813LWR5_POLGL|nr:unnamed protein product [Polarella glacialis]